MDVNPAEGHYKSRIEISWIGEEHPDETISDEDTHRLPEIGPHAQEKWTSRYFVTEMTISGTRSMASTQRI